MHRQSLIVLLLLGFYGFAGAAAEEPAHELITNPENHGTEGSKMDDEGEAKGIIPSSVGVTASTQPVTPITSFPEKKPHDQAKEELAQADALFKKGDMEAASDTALEAYDDLMDVHFPRRKRDKSRAQLRTQRYQAASVYVQSSIAFIQEFIARAGNTPPAIEEGRSRLEDLRDVARDYDDLRALLNKAEEQLPAPKHP